MRPANAALQDDKLLQQERILGAERGLTPRQVGQRAGDEGCDGRPCGGEEATMEGVRGRVSAVGEAL